MDTESPSTPNLPYNMTTADLKPEPGTENTTGTVELMNLFFEMKDDEELTRIFQAARALYQHGINGSGYALWSVPQCILTAIIWERG